MIVPEVASASPRLFRDAGRQIVQGGMGCILPGKEKIVRHYAQFEASYRKELGLEPPQELRSQKASYLE
ncbi:hypothetical protein [Paenibacillus terrae]|uniref:hypothetical protein n=1 Tax=Paenibacillus terrae TaxID=159743 RepID=UPI001BAEB452|nr:hypothetical protein [Paenibacillus terrae]